MLPSNNDVVSQRKLVFSEKFGEFSSFAQPILYQMHLTLVTVWRCFGVLSAITIWNVNGYGEPSEFGCHEFVNITHSDSIFRFESVPHRRTSNGRSFNDRLCSFDANGAAWTIIQSRGLHNSSSVPETFSRSWDDYKNGFGDLNGEFWYGNDFLHALTYNDDMQLEIRLESWDNRTLHIGYDIFRIDSEENRYNLYVDGYRGVNKSLDAMKYHHGLDFSTFDRQNDKSGVDDRETCCSCAKSYASGWWFDK